MRLPKIGARQFKALLVELQACPEAVKWARGKSSADAYRTCRRGDWMLWILAQQIGQPGWPTHPQVVLLACACAERALRNVPACKDRPRLAIEAARRWTNSPAAAAAGAAYAARVATAGGSVAGWAVVEDAAWASAWAAEHRAMCVAMRKMIRGFKMKRAKA